MLPTNFVVRNSALLCEVNVTNVEFCKGYIISKEEIEVSFTKAKLCILKIKAKLTI